MWTTAAMRQQVAVPPSHPEPLTFAPWHTIFSPVDLFPLADAANDFIALTRAASSACSRQVHLSRTLATASTPLFVTICQRLFAYGSSLLRLRQSCRLRVFSPVSTPISAPLPRFQRCDCCCWARSASAQKRQRASAQGGIADTRPSHRPFKVPRRRAVLWVVHLLIVCVAVQISAASG